MGTCSQYACITCTPIPQVLPFIYTHLVSLSSTLFLAFNAFLKGLYFTPQAGYLFGLTLPLCSVLLQMFAIFGLLEVAAPASCTHMAHGSNRPAHTREYGSDMRACGCRLTGVGMRVHGRGCHHCEQHALRRIVLKYACAFDSCVPTGRRYDPRPIWQGPGGFCSAAFRRVHGRLQPRGDRG